MAGYTPLPPVAHAGAVASSRLSPILRMGPIDDLEEALASSWLDVSRAKHRFMSLLREFDARQGWRIYGCNDCAEWLDFKLKVSRKTALEKVRVAKALWFLPKIDAAFGEGRLSYSQVRAITRVADAKNEEDLLDYALTSTAEHLEQYCQRLRKGNEAAAKQQALRDHCARSLEMYQHSGELVVKLPPEAFALVEQVILQAVENLPEDVARTPAAARADALVEVLTRKATGEAGNSEAYQVLVHVDAEALSREGGESDLPLPTVQRLCCDGPVVPILKDGDDVLNVGRRQRTVPAAIKRALAARDRSCRFPGCHHRHYLDAHHIQHWCDGGETSLDNLVLLCTHHHKLVHEGGFKLVATRDGYFFARPDGRPVETPSSAEDGECCREKAGDWVHPGNTLILANGDIEQRPNEYSD